MPIVSIELKNHFTGQNVQHAIGQYRKRDAREPFWKRCLVHFAVDDDAAYMTTHVCGPETAFLPFNRETQNPVIPERFASSYLWDDFTGEDGEHHTGILRADSLLLLIQNYLHYERDEKTGKEKFIFPRFHQFMAVRKLLAHAKAHGSGQNYLIQHSAGSGKSNSIAWLAHQLANLCGQDGDRHWRKESQGRIATEPAFYRSASLSPQSQFRTGLSNFVCEVSPSNRSISPAASITR